MSLPPLRLPSSWNECDDDDIYDYESDEDECDQNLYRRIGEMENQFDKRYNEEEELYQNMMVSIVDFSGKSFKLLKTVLNETECERNWEKMKEQVKDCIKEELISEVKSVNKYWFYQPSDNTMKLLVNKVILNLLYECQYECKYQSRIERLKKETISDMMMKESVSVTRG